MHPVNLLDLVLLLMGASVILALIARRLRTPPAVVFVAGGMALAVTPGIPAFELDPDLAMTLFLPPLLQSSAFFTPWRDFRANLRPILLLAVGAVAFTTLAVGVAMKWLVPSVPWAACFTLGAIISPPDAVSAGAVLERLHIPRKLLAVLEGESLVNDASGLVLYRFGIAVALGGTFNAGWAAASFVMVAIGGIAIGCACGYAQVRAIRLLRDSNLEIAVSFLAAWGSYIAAEAVGASGVLSTVASGLVLGWWQHDTFTAETRQEARAAWSFVTFILESLVFVLIGLSLRGVLPRLANGMATEALTVAAAITVVTIVARFVWVFPVSYLQWLTPRLLFWRKHEPHVWPPFRVPLVVSWAGMRGVVSLAAALALPEDFPGRDAILFVTFAVILGTVMIQATTLGPLIQRLRLGRDGEDGNAEDATARAAMAQAQLRLINERADDVLVGPIARDLLDEYKDTAMLFDGSPVVGAKRALLQARLGLRLDALDAARAEVLRMQRSGAIHDTVLRQLEQELDFQDVRFRQLLRATTT